MTIADTLIKQILADVRWNLPVETSGDDQLPVETLLPQGIFEDALDLDTFSDREPDSLEESCPENIQSLCLLGTYHHMHSPGVITLYRKNIEAYWRSLLKHAHRQFPLYLPSRCRAGVACGGAGGLPARAFSLHLRFLPPLVWQFI